LGQIGHARTGHVRLSKAEHFWGYQTSVRHLDKLPTARHNKPGLTLHATTFLKRNDTATGHAHRGLRLSWGHNGLSAHRPVVSGHICLRCHGACKLLRGVLRQACCRHGVLRHSALLLTLRLRKRVSHLLATRDFAEQKKLRNFASRRLHLTHQLLFREVLELILQVNKVHHHCIPL
jgi:hypothetical protein